MNKHQGITWPCKMCPYKSAGPHILSEHMRRVHSDHTTRKHRCPECEKSFVKRYSLTLHKRIHTGFKPKQCENCPMKFSLRIPKQHRLGLCNITNDIKRNEIKCMLCSFCSDNVNILKLHALSHQDEAANILKELPQSLKEVCFGTTEEFKTDLNTFLEKYGIKSNIDEFILKCMLIIVECPECGKNMKPDSIKRHMRIVHNETKEDKDLELAKTPLNEMSHLKKKKGENNNSECKECGKKMLRDSIKRHMRNVHSETNDDKDIEPAETFTMKCHQ